MRLGRVAQNASFVQMQDRRREIDPVLRAGGAETSERVAQRHRLREDAEDGQSALVGHKCLRARLDIDGDRARQGEANARSAEEDSVGGQRRHRLQEYAQTPTDTLSPPPSASAWFTRTLAMAAAFAPAPADCTRTAMSGADGK